jgi:hypothetical protein
MITDLIDRTWLFFYTAAAEVAERLGLSAGKAQRMLREVCARCDIRTKQMVFRDDKWVEEPTKPSDWAKDEIDIEWQRREGITDDGQRSYLLDVEKLIETEPEKSLELMELYERMKEARRKLELLGDEKVLAMLEADDKLSDNSVGIFVNGDDFQHWLNELKPPSASAAGKGGKGGKAPLIIEHLKGLYPQGVPEPALCPRKALKADLLARDKRLEPLDDATLKSAIDAFNRSIRNDPK